MDQHADPGDRSIEGSLKATYRALLARGLEAGEAANLTAFLHGLPSVGFHWTLPEVEGILRRRIAHVAEQRSAGLAALSAADAHRAAHPDRHGSPVVARRRGTEAAMPGETETDRPGDRHPNHPSRRSTIHDRRRFHPSSTHVIDPRDP
jgi:hypothetical protein